jgi:hypothetical protein
MITYDRPVTDIIRTRRSWRSYRQEPLDAADRARIQSFLYSLDCPPFGSAVRFVLSGDHGRTPGRVRGTYGIVTGAPSFLVGVLRPSEGGYEDFGYLFEAAVLHITSLDLCTCWMGGTFDRGYFADVADLDEGEVIPAVSPVGHAAPKRSLVDSVFALTAGSRSRRPFSTLFFRNDFSTPLTEPDAGPYGSALEMVRLAPSATNRQPWRVVMRDGALHFYLVRTIGYSSLFGGIDLQRIDMGIAMFHFQRTLEEQGHGGAWRIADPGITGLPFMGEYVVSWLP